MHLFAPDDPRPVHFMGIAGAGMSALALIARRRGVIVTGCDSDPAGAPDLSAAGAYVQAGHDASHVRGARAVIHTAAVSPDHPELEAARAENVPVVRRADALGQLVADHKVVAVAGTHGKTTVTAMATEALAAAGRDPTGLVGGRVATWDGNARYGSSQLFVVEADEYDRAFLALEPTVAVVNNIEADHLECYGSFDELEGAFLEFASRAEHVLIGADDKGASRLGRMLENPVWRVGTASDADVHIGGLQPTGGGTTSRIRFPDGSEVDLVLGVPGFHNARNAAMALAVVFGLGEDVNSARHGLADFGGVSRRFEQLGEYDGIMLIDDYAHHPSEVVATLAAARQRFPGRRIVAVFQPHLFSRTKTLGSQLGVALSVADHVVVTEVFPAREDPIPGVDGRVVVRAVKRAGIAADWIPELEDVSTHLAGMVKSGDVVLMLGAGDITRVGPELARRLSGLAA